MRFLFGLAVLGALITAGFIVFDRDSPTDQLEAAMRDRCEHFHGDLARTDDALDDRYLRLLRRENGARFADAIARDADSLSILGCQVGGPVARMFTFPSRKVMLRTARLHEATRTCAIDTEFFDLGGAFEALCDELNGEIIGEANVESTQESLREAYATLEAATEDVPTARLPRLGKGEVEIVRKGETYEASPGRDVGLLDYFSEQGITFGVALIDDESERGIALNGIEFTNATDSITLIAPEELRYGSARELLAGGTTFAAISTSGQIYCIDDSEVGVEPCPAPALPDK